MRFVVVALALFAAACGQNESVLAQIERTEAEQARVAETNLAASHQFMTETAARPGITAFPSGLLIEREQESLNQNLPRAGRDGQVLVHYQGALANGEVFDSSIQRGEPAEFPVEGLIAGFTEALTQMRPGDAITAYIPPEIGYGPEGSPPAIPPNSALVFRIQLLALRTGAGQTYQAPQAR